ncbi:BRCT domain-containing protein [Dorcoceras hygrometricum]|uniref:BRCT domain-containing protein n=1 Tax=Dorcoceras hygrometricum TaxID=472368 RepID=A0A2Z6ZXL9_9LAMI|nr:BRCT domain-containing protein [Dorcoceras hygrometricum]
MGKGIDRLYHCSVQPGYLKILQMGNTDPRHKSRKTKYEFKPQYEELSKQLNMQHAINQCYECMRAVKGIRSARPVYQPANKLKSPLYHSVSTGKSSVREHRGPSAHHSLVVDTRIRARQKFTACETDFSWFEILGRRLQGTEIQKLKRAGCRICSTGNAHAEAFGIFQLVVPGFLTSINRKSKSQGV